MKQGKLQMTLKQSSSKNKKSPQRTRDVTQGGPQTNFQRVLSIKGITYFKKNSQCSNSNSKVKPTQQPVKQAANFRSSSCLTKKRSRAPSKTFKTTNSSLDDHKEALNQSRLESEETKDNEAEQETVSDSVVSRCRPSRSGLDERQANSPETLTDGETRLGIAAKHLKDNPFAEHLASVVSDDILVEKNSTVRQLRHAILGTGDQCKLCQKFQGGSLKWQKQHAYECSDSQVYRINFLKLNGLYFCYYGCEQRYSDRTKLIGHLVSQHRESLSDWGFSHSRLEKLLTNGQQWKRPRSKEIGSQTNETDGPLLPLFRDTCKLEPSHADGAEGESWLIRQLLGSAKQGADSKRILSVKDKGRTIRLDGSLMRLFSLEKLRSDRLTTLSILTHYDREHYFADKFPKLALRPCILFKHSPSVVSVTYPFDARTPRMLWKDRRIKDFETCFLKALEALTILHKEFKIFYGGIRCNTIALTDDGHIAFLDWSNSCEMDSPATSVPHSSKTYPPSQTYKRVEDYFIADLQALAITFLDLLRTMMLGESLSRSPLLKRLSKRGRKAKTNLAFYDYVSLRLFKSEFEEPEDRFEDYRSGEVDYDEIVDFVGAHITDYSKLFQDRVKTPKYQTGSDEEREIVENCQLEENASQNGPQRI